MNDLENALVRMNVHAAMKKAQQQPADVTTVGALLLCKGDVDGHEFHGNQYSNLGERASDKANTASDKAAASSKVGDHAIAMGVQLDASAIHEELGNKQAAAMHAAKAKEHQKLINADWEAYKSNQKNVVRSGKVSIPISNK